MSHRFFVPNEAGYAPGQPVTLPAATAHQVRSVLRMQPGDGLVLLDNAGFAYDAVLTQVSRQAVLVEIGTKRPFANEPTVQISLYQSLLKRDNFEWVLQKGTELGVSHFVPLETRRSVAGFKPKKLDRWQRIVTEAAEQSRRGRIPTIAAARSLPDAVATATADLRLLPWEESAEQGISGPLMEQRPLSVALFIGPEGGFDPDEVALAQQHGVQPVTLGPRILRAETAAVVSVALVLQVLGELA